MTSLPSWLGQPRPAASGDVPTSSLVALLDLFFPGFSSLSDAIFKYLGLNLNVYIPVVVLFSGLAFSWSYISGYIWNLVSSHFMSTVEIRVDDEIYNIVMAWVAAQKFAQSSRRFVVNTNLSSRSWFIWRWRDDDEDDEGGASASTEKHRKTLSYTPSFGSHVFWYRGRLLLFQRTQNRNQMYFTPASEREEISIACFGRSPWILKELLLEAKLAYVEKDAKKTLIYRGTFKGASAEPTWERNMSRDTRPLSTVILSADTKKRLLDDMTDYLDPATRRWYSNRGIPYRRGYLLYGPPGTGKSSLSLALAGHFNLRIYIVSLSSIHSNEENLTTLFSELPRRCVVLLEDIDTAGLTNTREQPKAPNTPTTKDLVSTTADQAPGAAPSPVPGRLSLSGLLNILDGVASQEGRILIMTTNHIEKLDKALIRPGRVDMSIEFGWADRDISASIFNAIYTALDADSSMDSDSPADEVSRESAQKKAAANAAVSALASEFATKIPQYEYSPAEIQGYLLRYKRDPEKAVQNVEKWIMEMREQKRVKAAGDSQAKAANTATATNVDESTGTGEEKSEQKQGGSTKKSGGEGHEDSIRAGKDGDVLSAVGTPQVTDDESDSSSRTESSISEPVTPTETPTETRSKIK
ncbi:putative BCS1 protein [Scedosporium apiospermum]|uniref:Putative BCS1 protein n=1 Tax=Pseudallescheria apiosperma TaxID=563466 RepID=A0A084G6N5_PSEDA|nr:putative BCS1 protein [Scedosporium apiospermum]KEZ42997.1 putative BCS1 protein [Scedosporium apiospermum]